MIGSQDDFVRFYFPNLQVYPVNRRKADHFELSQTKMPKETFLRSKVFEQILQDKQRYTAGLLKNRIFCSTLIINVGYYHFNH